VLETQGITREHIDMSNYQVKIPLPFGCLTADPIPYYFPGALLDPLSGDFSFFTDHCYDLDDEVSAVSKEELIEAAIKMGATIDKDNPVIPADLELPIKLKVIDG